MRKRIECPYTKAELLALYEKHGSARQAGDAEGLTGWQQMWRWMKQAGVEMRSGRPKGRARQVAVRSDFTFRDDEGFDFERAQQMSKAVLVQAVDDAAAGDVQAVEFLAAATPEWAARLQFWCELADEDPERFYRNVDDIIARRQALGGHEMRRKTNYRYRGLVYGE